MIVDARGHRCPTPTLKLQRAMREAPCGSRVTLLATDPLARIDVPHLLAGAGGSLISITDADGVLTIVVETPGAPRG